MSLSADCISLMYMFHMQGLAGYGLDEIIDIIYLRAGNRGINNINYVVYPF